MAEHFHALRIAEIVPETAEANSIRFEIPPELRDKFVFKAGQHLTLRATINGEEVGAIIRCAPRPTRVTGWSPSSESAAGCFPTGSATS